MSARGVGERRLVAVVTAGTDLASASKQSSATFERITGRPPRPVAEFLHEYRAEFV